MSARNFNRSSISNLELLNVPIEELKSMFHSTLKKGLHGICASPYKVGQKPGDQLSEEQVRERLEIIKPYIKWIRSFSCTEGNELIPIIAKELGIKTMVGAWLGDNKSTNTIEIENLIKLCKDGFVDIAAVGNEVMYRGDLSEEELLSHIKHVKNEIAETNIPVGYVDAYYEFEERPAITRQCDVILSNCYPYWEGCELNYAILHMKDMYNRALKVAEGKKVIITETGWPSQGTSMQEAHPSEENALKYFINTQKWVLKEGIECFYFSSFDETWKSSDEGDVGPYWGLWNENQKLKY